MKTLLLGIGVIAAIGLSLYRRCTLNPMTSGDLVYRDEEPGNYWLGIVLYVFIAAGSFYLHYHPQCFS